MRFHSGTIAQVLMCMLFACLVLPALADPVVRELDNGITLIVDEMHSAPVAAVRFYVRAGSIYEDRFMGAGITHYLEHLIGKGSLTRSAEEIDNAQEEMGNQGNAYTTSDHTCYHMQSSARYVDDMIKLIADYVFNPLLDAGEIEKQRAIILREMAMGEDDPQRDIYQLFMESMFRIHPVRYRVIGYPDKFRQVSREDLVEYHNRMYTTDNVYVVVVGDFDANHVLEVLKQSLGGVPRRGLDFPAIPAEPAQTSTRFAEEIDPSLSRAYLSTGYQTVDLFHPDLFPLDVLAYILGNGATSRLVSSVRERQGLVDGIGCYSATPAFGAGRFVISATLDEKNLDKAREAILAELKLVQSKPVTPAELRRAKKQKEAELVYARSSVESWASTLGGDYLSTGDVDFSKHYVEGIRGVTARQIRAVASRYLRPENMTTAVRRAGQSEAGQAAQVTTASRPQTDRTQLPNGITLLVSEDHSAPMVSVQASFLGGLRYETDKTAGIGKVLASMLDRGTPSRTRLQIAQALEDVGASMGAMSGRNSFNVSGSALTADTELLIGIMADCIRNPSFPQSELDRVRQLSLAAIKAMQDDADQIPYKMMLAKLFASHPYALDPAGTEESVTAIAREALAAHHSLICQPDQMVLAVYGDVSAKTIKPLVEELFGDWKPARARPLKVDAAPSLDEALRVDKQRPQQQGMIYFGFRGPTVKSDDRYALDVLDAAFSGIDYPGGRLHDTLRGEGLVYATHMVPVAGLDPGFVMVYAATQPEKLQRVETVIRDLIADIQKNPLPAEELERARKMCISAHEVAMGSVGDRILQETLDELYSLGFEETLKYAERVEKVTAEQVQAAANKYMNLDSCVIAVTAPPGSGNQGG